MPLSSLPLQDVINAAARMKIVGNAYYKKEQFVKAHLKYKKALRYLNKYQVREKEITLK